MDDDRMKMFRMGSEVAKECANKNERKKLFVNLKI